MHHLFCIAHTKKKSKPAFDMASQRSQRIYVLDKKIISRHRSFSFLPQPPETRQYLFKKCQTVFIPSTNLNIATSRCFFDHKFLRQRPRKRRPNQSGWHAVQCKFYGESNFLISVSKLSRRRQLWGCTFIVYWLENDRSYELMGFVELFQHRKHVSSLSS